MRVFLRDRMSRSRSRERERCCIVQAVTFSKMQGTIDDLAPLVWSKRVPDPMKTIRRQKACVKTCYPLDSTPYEGTVRKGKMSRPLQRKGKLNTTGRVPRTTGYPRLFCSAKKLFGHLKSSSLLARSSHSRICVSSPPLRPKRGEGDSLGGKVYQAASLNTKQGVLNEAFSSQI